MADWTGTWNMQAFYIVIIIITIIIIIKMNRLIKAELGIIDVLRKYHSNRFW